MEKEMQLEQLFQDLKKFVEKYEFEDVYIYYKGNRYNLDEQKGILRWQENTAVATDYMIYGNNDTISVSFEGELYSIMNYPDSEMAVRIKKEFNELTLGTNLYCEYGEAWNLSYYFE